MKRTRTMKQSISSKDKSNDVKAGHDKCFSALGKEILKDEYQNIHDSNASTSKDNIPHEKRGNGTDDEEDEERMIDPSETVDLDQDFGEIEIIEKPKRILDKSDTIINRAKIVLDEIIIEGKDYDDMSQMQWNKVEI